MHKTFIEKSWEKLKSLIAGLGVRIGKTESDIQVLRTDIESLEHQWDLVTSENITSKVTAKSGYTITNAVLYRCGKFAQLAVSFQCNVQREANSSSYNPFTVDTSLLPSALSGLFAGNDRIVGYITSGGNYWGTYQIATPANQATTAISIYYPLS